MKLIFTVLTLLLFLSCKKDAHSTREINGLVLHKFTRQPVSGCEVILEYGVLDRTARSPEFPEGLPRSRILKTVTNPQGEYAFRLVLDNNAWPTPYLGQGGYQGTATFLIARPTPISDTISSLMRIDKSRFDTIWAEKEGYIRFLIQNTGTQFSDDTLVINKSYYARHTINLQLPRVGDLTQNRNSYLSNRMGFAGADVTRIVIDTLAAESISELEIEWIYKRSDTLIKKQETIHVSPGATTDVTIHY